MFLAVCEEEYPDQLRADFQEYYRLNIDRMGSSDGFSHSHAAVLAAQLPQHSRVFCAIDPNNAWTDEVMFLAHIEYGIRVLAWQQTKDGQKGRNQPKPHKTPAERRAALKRREGVNKALVDATLGVHYKGD